MVETGQCEKKMKLLLECFCKAELALWQDRLERVQAGRWEEVEAEIRYDAIESSSNHWDAMEPLEAVYTALKARDH